MTKKVTMGQISKLISIRDQVEKLQGQLPAESDVAPQLDPIIKDLIKAIEMLKDEFQADR